MEYVKMPELLSTEAVNVLAGNAEVVKTMISSRDTVSRCLEDEGVCCPKKVKFIFILNNVVIININAVAEEEDRKKPPRQS